MAQQDVYIVSACRTPVGSFKGNYSAIPAHELGGVVIKEALHRAHVDPQNVSEVIMGHVLTAGQGQNPARQASLKAGLPVTVPAHTTNMVCGSGLKAVYEGFISIKAGENKIVVAGGQENMTLAPHTAFLRNGCKFGSLELQDTMATDGLTDATHKIPMGNTAEHLAVKFNISRERQDEFASSSQNKAENAIKNGYFEKEIVPVPKGGAVISVDEPPRFNTTVQTLSRLRPVFSKEPTASVTAGNSSGINDGAAAVVLASATEAQNRNLPKLAKIVAFAQVGNEPMEMGIAPIEAVKLVLQKAGWTADEVDLFELNEAFAVQSLIIVDQLKINREKVNVTGGAIALGHPIGCSGARVLVTLIHNLKRLGRNKGVASLCIGGGLGIAIAIQCD